MASPRGFEPPACRLGGDRSILLSYGDTPCGDTPATKVILSNMSSDVKRNFRFQLLTSFSESDHQLADQRAELRRILDRHTADQSCLSVEKLCVFGESFIVKR